jgi:small subunit ribosomal protein S9
MAEEQTNVQTPPPAVEQGGQGPAAEAPPPPAPKPAGRSAPPLPEGMRYIWGTGRRKKATARVRIRPGSGQVLVNDRKVEEFFTEMKDRQAVAAPLEAADMIASWDVWAKVDGGGRTGQAGALMLGLARAIAKAVPDVETTLRDRGLLTRDSRMKERKKYGQKGARKRFQYSKR